MSFSERFLRFMHWPASRKTALLGALLLPLHLLGWVNAADLRAMSDEPVTRMVETISAWWLAAAAGAFAASAFAAWRGRTAAWTAYLFAAIHAGFIGAMVLSTGGRSLFPLWIPASALLMAFWFDERVGGAHLLMCMGVMAGAVALLSGGPPQPSPELQWPLQRAAVLVALFALLGSFLLGLMVLSVQRLLRERLDAANRDLERGQRLIRRYVPAQLADRIATGGHVEGGKHERRKLTLFFSDVVGFTDLSDELDAEELAAFLNEYLSEMTTIADRHGATVNQLVGDGIMIFFGAPTATDDRDHALRCVRMALAMQRRMTELREIWFKRGLQRPFQVRIGINTGFASVGDFGSQGRTMYSAIGQQTNLAARIQSHCQPGKVLISHSTWALVHDAVPCTPKGQIEVKGLHYPVLVYEVADSAVSGLAA